MARRKICSFSPLFSFASVSFRVGCNLSRRDFKLGQCRIFGQFASRRISAFNCDLDQIAGTIDPRLLDCRFRSRRFFAYVMHRAIQLRFDLSIAFAPGFSLAPSVERLVEAFTAGGVTPTIAKRKTGTAFFISKNRDCGFMESLVPLRFCSIRIGRREIKTEVDLCRAERRFGYDEFQHDGIDNGADF